MTTRNHTPGPWIFDAQNSGTNSDPGWGLLNADGESLGITVHWDRRSSTDTAYANARLIAAAPELLEALKMVVRHGSAVQHSDQLMFEVLSAARAAIAKAEGGTDPNPG